MVLGFFLFPLEEFFLSLRNVRRKSFFHFVPLALLFHIFHVRWFRRIIGCHVAESSEYNKVTLLCRKIVKEEGSSIKICTVFK